jgi:hypothetical protein
MKFALSAVFISVALASSMPASALDNAACLDNWSKMDTTKQGYVMHADHKEHMEKMKAAGHATVGTDRITHQEYMNACIADVFSAGKR